MNPSTLIHTDTLQRILYHHSLGNLKTVHEPPQGYMNWCFILNDAFVLRIDAGRTPHTGRFLSERRAYDLLKYSGIPVPQVIALDRSKSIVPYEYIITTKLPGTQLIQDWQTLSPAQQSKAAWEAGKYLAMVHGHSLGHFGNLRSMVESPYQRWFDFVLEFLQRYLEQAHTQEILSSQLAEASLHYAQHQQPLLDTIKHGYLVHSDYHFENILHENGIITGVIDFEWALAGDPSWDFIVEDRWEAHCAGSREPLLAGYTSLRQLDQTHTERLKLYKMLLYVETLVMQHKDGDMAGKQVTLGKLEQLVG